MRREAGGERHLDADEGDVLLQKGKRIVDAIGGRERARGAVGAVRLDKGAVRARLVDCSEAGEEDVAAVGLVHAEWPAVAELLGVIPVGAAARGGLAEEGEERRLVGQRHRRHAAACLPDGSKEG